MALDVVTVDQERELHKLNSFIMVKLSTEGVSPILILSPVICLLHRIVKRSNRGCLPEHLESSGTNNYDERTNCAPIMRGKKLIQTVDDEFHFFHTVTFFLCCWFTTLSTHLESFWSYIC